MTGLMLALAVAASPVRATPPPPGPQADADRVMRLVATEQYEPAGEEMARQYVWPGPKDRFAKLFKSYSDLLAHPQSQLGPPLKAAELVRSEPAGPSFARLTYVVKFEKHATVWKLTYYRPADEWKLHNITFDIHPQAVERLFAAEK